MAAQILHKRSSSLQEAPALKRWKSQTWAVEGIMAPPTAECFDLTVKSLMTKKTGFKVEDSMLLQEPTSVLDLQTSPGRSCSSVSLSSQPSISGEETSFPLQNGKDSCVDERTSGSPIEGSTGASVHPDQDIASWMDCMEDPNGPLALPEFDECEGGEGHTPVIKLERAMGDDIHFVNANIDFSFELSLDGCEQGSFPSFPVSSGLLSEMLSDPGLCLMDEPKFIPLTEGFQDVQRLQDMDDTLSTILVSTNGLRAPGVLQNDQSASTSELIRLLGSQSSESPCSQGSGVGSQGGAATARTNVFDGPARLGQGHARSESWGSSQGPAQPEDSGLHLVHLLLACAEAIDDADFDIAKPMLSRLRVISNPYGDPMQRIALYFADALSDRLEREALPTSETPREFPKLSIPSANDSELAYQAFYQVLPFAKFAHFTANQAIFEAVGGSNRIHVVDLDIRQGLQWPSFIQSLAMRPGGSPHLRITAVGTNLAALQVTGRRLAEFSLALEVSFEFCPLVERVENLHQGLVRVLPGEALAINCSQVLHTFSGDQATLEIILVSMRRLNPVVITLLEVEANHNVSPFIARFVEALHYYCALFDSLEGSLGRESPDRFRIEHVAFASEIKDIVALEGTNRRAGHVKSETWQTHFLKSGFRALPLSSYAVQQAQLLLGFYTTGEMPYKLSEEFNALTLGWQDTPVMAVSSWSC